MIEPHGRCDLTVIVLTLNEEVHIRRCIKSVRDVASRVVVVDSGSIDRTCQMAKSLGAEIFSNPFSTHAKQLNWGLDHAKIDTRWVMKLDADEYLTPELALLLPEALLLASETTSGFTLNLRRIFMGKWLRHGSLYPIKLLRIWKFGKGRCEERLMDEHLIVKGEIKHIDADFADDNLNSLTWWTEKHNRYSSREAVELLNLEYKFISNEAASNLRVSKQASVKRWIKEVVYSRLPVGFRAFFYFFYRYAFRLGFLDGQAGTVFHVLQGFWYRYLVDAKVAEVKRYMHSHKTNIKDAIVKVLGIQV